MIGRVIKFRQWSNKQNRYLGYWGIGDIDGDESYQKGPYADQTSEHEQFIGLLDVNGVEIYEGDVLLFGLITGIVAFDGVGYHLQSLNPEGAGYILKARDYYESKIIGNIHDTHTTEAGR
jgi:hypothetical protein